MKKEKGSLTVEASVALFVFLFFFLLLISLEQYSRIQNQVKHSLNQTVQTMSLINSKNVKQEEMRKSVFAIDGAKLAGYIACFDQEKAQEFNSFCNLPYTAAVASNTGKSTEQKSAYNNEDMEKEIKKYFVYYMAPEKSMKQIESSDLDALLAEKGVTNLQITPEVTTDSTTNQTKEEYVSGNVLTVNLSYEIKAPFSKFSLFGVNGSPTFSESIKFVLMK